MKSHNILVYSVLLIFTQIISCHIQSQNYLVIDYTGVVELHSHPFPIAMYSGETKPILSRGITHPIEGMDFEVPIKYVQVDSTVLTDIIQTIHNFRSELDSLPHALPYQFGTFRYTILMNNNIEINYSNSKELSKRIIEALQLNVYGYDETVRDPIIPVLAEYLRIFYPNPTYREKKE